jgi:hypothetical protein
VEIEDITLEEEGLVVGIASTVDIGRRGFIRVIIMLVSSPRFFAFCTQFYFVILFRWLKGNSDSGCHRHRRQIGFLLLMTFDLAVSISYYLMCVVLMFYSLDDFVFRFSNSWSY